MEVGEKSSINSPNHQVVIDNASNQLHPDATVQLHSGGRPVDLQLTDEWLVRTDADIINYDYRYIVNEYSSDNSVIGKVKRGGNTLFATNDELKEGNNLDHWIRLSEQQTGSEDRESELVSFDEGSVFLSDGQKDEVSEDDLIIIKEEF